MWLVGAVSRRWVWLVGGIYPVWLECIGWLVCVVACRYTNILILLIPTPFVYISYFL